MTIRRVVFDQWQKPTLEDFQNIGGLFTRETFDIVLKDLGPGWGFSGFNVVRTSDVLVTVGSGTLYDPAGRVFGNFETTGTPIDLVDELPTATRRRIAIVVYGTEIFTDTEPRTFLTNATTRANQARVVSTENRRHANISAVAGPVGPDPAYPTVASDVVVVAWVMLGTTGIESIEVAADNRVQGMKQLRDRLNGLDTWKEQAGTRLDTLAADLSAVAARVRGTATIDATNRLAGEIANIKEVLDLPDDYSDWAADHFLTEDESAPEHVDYLARVEEGVRFPHAIQSITQIQRQNQFSTDVRVANDFMLPAYNETTRLSNWMANSELSLSQYAYRTLTWQVQPRPRYRVRWGTAFVVCTNHAAWWGSLDQIDPITMILRRGGETYRVLEVTPHPTGAESARILRLQQFWTDEIMEYATIPVWVDEGVSGTVTAQTFLNSQEGWFTSFNLGLTRVAATGNITMALCECNEDGSPNLTKILGTSVVLAANLRALPGVTNFPFVPIRLKAGRRYAGVVVTPGNHFVGISHNNHFSGGSLFYSTDQAWFQGDTLRDMCMQVNFAQFLAPRVEIPLEPLQLVGGIAAVDINVDIGRSSAENVTFQVQHNGVWRSLEYFDVHPLNALPANLPFRVVLEGTVTAMPGIGIGPNSRVEVWRPRSDFRHISDIRTLRAPANTIYVDLRLEGWRGAPYHTNTCRLLVGTGYTTVEMPDAVTDEPDPRDPNAIVRRFTFSLPAAISSYRIRIEGTTDNVVTTYHVARRLDVANTV